ncbi:pentatricopeptide repeat-containing protein At1g62350-like [Diospyros lotus]|uniref:pentatricopeptide repeat-containing protein At1g62350-like n=1 Tax=Diospyros lotus TaxID=55363 RepID=UPI002252E0C9|nr:pentatricopeptide repeat-containing protein At1g62350-like [Diospyros lotus]
MRSGIMGSLNFHTFRLGIRGKPEIGSSPARPPAVAVPRVRCGLRNAPRKPMWKKRVLSTEAIQAVQSLKLAKAKPSGKLDEVFRNRLSRLLKADLLDALAELQRQNEVDLALKVFEFVRKEVWYQPDLSLFCDVILMLGKNKQIEEAEEFFSELKKEGLEPNTRAFAEMIGAYFKVDMIQKAIEMYELMKISGCAPDKLTLTILIRNLEKSGEEELAASVKKECADYMDSPERFLKEVERKYTKQSLNLV